MPKAKYMILLPLTLAASLSIADDSKIKEKWKAGVNKLNQKVQEFQDNSGERIQDYNQKSQDAYRQGQQIYQQQKDSLGYRTREFKESDLGQVVEEKLNEIIRDPSKVYGLERDLKKAGVMYISPSIKNIPIYDKQDATVKTLDFYLREKIADSSLRLPKEIADDPVTAILLTSADPMYLLNANTISLNGQWTSINHALSMNPGNTDIMFARDSYLAAMSNLNSSNTGLAIRNLTNFAETIEKINHGKLDSKPLGHKTKLMYFLTNNPVYAATDNLSMIVLKDSPIEKDYALREKINLGAMASLAGLLTLGSAMLMSRKKKKAKKEVSIVPEVLHENGEKYRFDKKSKKYVLINHP